MGNLMLLLYFWVQLLQLVLDSINLHRPIYYTKIFSMSSKGFWGFGVIDGY